MEHDCGPCVLRSWKVTDAASLARNANDREVWLNLRDRFPHPYTLKDALQWVLSAPRRVPETNLAIAVGGEAVGGIGLQLNDDVERCSAEVGYWLGREHWGKGITSAALGAFTRAAMESFGLTRIYALPFARNAASIRVLEKAGYVREGVLRRSAIKEGIVEDQLLYAVTDEDLARGG